MTLDAIMSNAYGDSGSDAGFCSNVDGNPHGALHVNLGNDRGMGQAPWAANDPVVWLHHCNMDRSSWAKAGGKNLDDASFKSTTFRFADSHGSGVQAKVADILELNDLDYEYDRYLDRPAGSPPFSAPSAAATLAVHAISRQVSGPVTLGANPTSVTLATQEVPSRNVPSSTNSLAAQIHVRLNVRASAAPGAGYDVDLGPIGQAAPRRSDPPFFVGSISFFGVAPRGTNGDHAAPAISEPRNYSFVVTTIVKQLQQTGGLTAEPQVTLVPTKAPREGSAPRIGSVSLVSS